MTTRAVTRNEREKDLSCTRSRCTPAVGEKSTQPIYVVRGFDDGQPEQAPHEEARATDL